MTFGVGRMLTSATSASRTRRPVGVSISMLADRSRLSRGLRRAPDLDVVGPAVREDVADLLAGHQGRRRPADVARLEAVALAPRRGSPRPEPAGTSTCSSTCRSTRPSMPIECRFAPPPPCPAARRGPGRRCARRSARSRRSAPRGSAPSGRSARRGRARDSPRPSPRSRRASRRSRPWGRR